MSYPTGHRAEVKRRIIDSARRLFNRYGFENVSLKQIMAGAGLTSGGFYSYFKSKSDLYAEVLGCFFPAYLSRQHYEDVENSCPMVALPTDVARSGVIAKRAFETVFRAMVSVLERSLVDRKGPRRTKAQAIAALCIGGMVVARTMVDRELADDLRGDCTAMALKLGGWEKRDGHARWSSRRGPSPIFSKC
jgi:hypothetical protein